MAGIPKGRLVPMYLTENGDLYPVVFHNMEELELCEIAITATLGGQVVVDTKTQINLPQEKLSIYNMKTRKITGGKI